MKCVKDMFAYHNNFINYRLADRVIIQRDIRIPDDMRIANVYVRFFRDWRLENRNAPVLYLLCNGDFYDVNLIGAVIIDLIANNEPLEKHLNMLAGLHGIPVDKIFEDTREFCKQLENLKVLVSEPARP